MKVLHLCPLWAPVTEDSAGDIERFVARLVRALDKLGCRSTVLASGDSRVEGAVLPVIETLGDAGIEAIRQYEIQEVMSAIGLSGEFDVVHSHLHYEGYALFGIGGLPGRVLQTQHHPVLRDTEWLVARHPDMALAMVTQAEVRSMRSVGARDCQFIPYGVDPGEFGLRGDSDGTLVFAGDMAPGGGADIAVRVSLETGRRLVIAATTPPQSREFFDRMIRPHLGKQVQWVGRIDHRTRLELMAGAACNVMPSRWPYAFPLTAVEAMACGTPLVVLGAGPLAELVQPGVSGYVADSERLPAELVESAAGLDRAQVRGWARGRFDIAPVAELYLRSYQRLAKETASTRPPPHIRRPPDRRHGEPAVLHVSPVWFTISRDSVGGIETLLAALLSSLSGLGVENTLLGPADSDVDAAVIPTVERHLVEQVARTEAVVYDPYELHSVLEAMRLAGQFDVVHSHLGSRGYVLSAVEGIRDRTVHTLHDEVSPQLVELVTRWPNMRLVTVSEHQARQLQGTGADCRVIPNGIDFRGFPFGAVASPRLVFLGAIRHRKGPDIAIRVAQEAALPLDLAGPTPSGAFFNDAIRPHLSDRVRYLGTVDHEQKVDLMGSASCVLMPSRWQEPFGLVAIEAMACGTPVVGLANGALPEIVEEGVGGFLATAEDELPGLVRRASRLDRRCVRASAASRFDISVTAGRYAELYREIAA